MDSNELLLENERLNKELSELQQEHMLIVHTVIKTLKSVELWPITENDNLASKAIKGVKTVIMESMMNPDKLAKRFDFLKDIYPLCEKYKDVEV